MNSFWGPENAFVFSSRLNMSQKGLLDTYDC